MRPLFFYFSLLFFPVLIFSSEAYSETSSEYVEKIHDDIVAVVIAKQGQYKEDPEEFNNLWDNLGYHTVKTGLMERSFDASMLSMDRGPRRIGPM